MGEISRVRYKRNIRSSAKLTSVMHSIEGLKEARTDLKTMWQFLSPRHMVRREDLAGLPNVNGRQFGAEEIKASDTLLLLGCNDSNAIAMAARMFHENPTLKIVVSGKGGHRTSPAPEYRQAEAVINAAKLIRLGVLDSRIRIEAESTNTGANIINSRNVLFAEDDGQGARKVIIVQSPAALLRATLCFERFWEQKFAWEYYISCPPALPNIDIMKQKVLDFNLAYALREATRTMNYSYNPKYDFQTRRKVPAFIIDIIKKYHNKCSSDIGINLTVAAFVAPDSPKMMEYLMNYFGAGFESIDRAYPGKNKG